MSWAGYFALGGREVGNNGRALGLQRTTDCPIRWTKGIDQCATLADALGDDEYTFANIGQAPWYDPDNPDRSSRILGLYVIEVAGLQDDTREATIEQKVTDGSHIGRTRRASRGVRVRAMLTAKGKDALEQGMTWLRGTLNARECGLHSTSTCGLADFEYFVDCPPARGTVPGFSEWIETRRNYFSNPRGTSTSATYWGSPALGAYSSRVDMTGGIATALRWTRSSAGIGAVRMVGGATMPDLGEQVRFAARVRASVAMTVDIYARADITSTSGQVLLSSQTLPVGVSEIDVSGASFAGAAGASSGIAILINTGAVSSTLDVTAVLIGYGGGAWFDGSSTDGTLARYQWLGATDLSQSTEETRVEIQVPDSDENYALVVDRYRRYMHSVKVTAGPTVIREMSSKNTNYFANIVEFTVSSQLSGIFTKMREIAIAPSIPTIVADVPFNTFKYPSGEKSLGTLQVARNYSSNPSLETNATDWVGSVATVSGGSPASYFTSGRVTGEVSAVGTASFRGRILGNGSTSASGRARIEIYQQVSLSGITISGSRMSFTEWVAALSVGGATGAAIVSVTVKAEWRASTTILSTTTIASSSTGADFAGKAYAQKSVPIPATADNVRVRVEVVVDWSSSATPASNSDIRVYVDALAATIP